VVFNVPCKISRVFYKLAYFRLGLGRTDIHSRGNDTSFVKIEDETYELFSSEVYSQIIRFIFKEIEAHGVCKNKKMTTSQDFLVEEWRIEGCVTKVIERILMNVGLLILHKIKVLIL